MKKINNKNNIILNASEADKWLGECELYANMNASSRKRRKDYSKEGDEAHNVFMRKLQTLSRCPEKEITIDEEKQSEYVTSALKAVQKVKDVIDELTRKGIDYKLHIEYILPGKGALSMIKGRCDCLIETEHEIWIFDYKYGSTIGIPSRNNNQLLVYAVNAQDKFRGICDIDTFHLAILQPRMNLYDVTDYSYKDIDDYRKMLLQKSEIFRRGIGAATCGEVCVHCNGFAYCREVEKYVKNFSEEIKVDPKCLSPLELRILVKQFPMILHYMRLLCSQVMIMNENDIFLNAIGESKEWIQKEIHLVVDSCKRLCKVFTNMNERRKNQDIAKRKKLYDIGEEQKMFDEESK